MPFTQTYVCPACRGRLVETVERGGVTCSACSGFYRYENGRPVLLVPGDPRFDDLQDCCLLSDEVRTNTFTTSNYHVPLLRHLFGPDLSELRLLSAGCGVGADVDVFRDAGVQAFGIDCGSRASAWSDRRHPQAFHFGNVAHLPYPDSAFDVVTTGCLLPHVGVHGDSTNVRTDYHHVRATVAAEFLRVLRPGGRIILGSPNRLCPVDLFHKGQMSRPNAMMRWHSPREPFLLSFGDHAELFGDRASLKPLSMSGYWGFHSKMTRASTRVLAQLLGLYFGVLSLPGLGWLRRSPLNPWLMVLVTKRTA